MTPLNPILRPAATARMCLDDRRKGSCRPNRQNRVRAQLTAGLSTICAVGTRLGSGGMDMAKEMQKPMDSFGVRLCEDRGRGAGSHSWRRWISTAKLLVAIT